MWEPSLARANVCPACGSLSAVPEDVVLGETIMCEACGAELEVIGLDPLRLDLYEEEEK